MQRPPRNFPLLLTWCLLAVTSVSAAETTWQTSQPGWVYEFPRDHGSHPDFKTEWWYFTGNLQTADGREFGYQLTFFRQGVIPPGEVAPKSAFGARDVKFAHFAVTEISSRTFHHFQKLSRGAFDEAGFDRLPRLAWIDNWTCELIGEQDFRLRARDGEVEIDLELRSAKPPVFHGKDGVSQKAEGSGRGSHYYSLTRLKTSGTIRVGNSVHAVRGLSWFDHEWATNQLAAHQTGWDWLSLQFEDRTELMLFQLRTTDGGRDEYSSGTWIAADGGTTKITNSDFVWRPRRWWTSAKTGGRYPVAWELAIPKLDLTLDVEARLDAQELAAEPVIYWEGAVAATGRRGGLATSARGYLEMTGYASPVRGMQER